MSPILQLRVVGVLGYRHPGGVLAKGWHAGGALIGGPKICRQNFRIRLPDGTHQTNTPLPSKKTEIISR